MTQNFDSEGFGPIFDLILELPRAPGLSLEASHLDWGMGHTCLALRQEVDKHPACSGMTQLFALDQTWIRRTTSLEANLSDISIVSDILRHIQGLQKGRPCSLLREPILRTSKFVFDNSWLYSRNAVLLSGVLQKPLFHVQVLIQYENSLSKREMNFT